MFEKLTKQMENSSGAEVPQISVQELLSQLDVLNQAGCKKKYNSIESREKEMPHVHKLDQGIEGPQESDTVRIWSFDCLRRSLYQVIMTLNKIQQNDGVGLCSICDTSLDTRTASGELLFNIFNALSRFEQTIIQEDIHITSVKTTKEVCRKCGRKPTTPDEQKVKLVKQMSHNTNISVPEICEILKISRATYYRYLNVTEFHVQGKKSYVSPRGVIESDKERRTQTC